MTCRKISKQLTLVFALLTAALPGMAQDTSLLQYEGADRTQKLTAAAQKEGKLTLYTSIAERDLAILLGPFEKKYGIKVKVWRAGADKVVQRALTETAAKRYEADAIHTGSTEMEALYREKIFQRVSSPYFKDLIQSALRPHREWTPTLLSVLVQAYNTNLVKKEDLPKTYQDLLDPRWKGKLGIEAKNHEWYAGVVMEMGEKKGTSLFNDIVSRNGMSVRKGHSLLNNMVIAGDVPLALTVYNYMPESAKSKGAPIDWFVLEPAIARANGIGVTRHARNPNAALLFHDYMLSPDVQKVLVKMDYVPINTKVPSPLANLRVKLVDPAVTLDQLDKWTKSFEDVMTKTPVK
jgi:iron(III) transport system substrate-binding protein